MRVHHYSLDMQYDLGHQYVMSLGYQGSLSRNIFFHENPLAVPATLGYTLNPQIGGGDYWGVNGRGNYNAMLAELKHQFSHQFMADAQFTWAKSMDTSSAPYSEQPYPYNVDLNYGRSDYNITKAVQAIWHVAASLLPRQQRLDGKDRRRLVDQRHLQLALRIPLDSICERTGGTSIAGQCGYTTLLPAAYLGGAGNSTSNDAFKGPVSSNFPKGGASLFRGHAICSSRQLLHCLRLLRLRNALPQSPGVGRNSLTMPGYKAVDMTLAKGFGLPNMPVLGENAKLEFRIDAFNLFNNMNFNENNISNNISQSRTSARSRARSLRPCSSAWCSFQLLAPCTLPGDGR